MSTHFILVTIAIMALASLVSASDPSSVQDFCVAINNSAVFVNGKVCNDPKLATADDFFFSGLLTPQNTSNPIGSKVTPVNVLQILGLNTLGISLARIDFAPYGLNPPHTHPRATEIIVVLEGTLYVGFVTSNTDNRLFTKRSGGRSMNRKMKELKLALKQWNSEVFGNVNTKLKKVEEELHEIDLVAEVRDLEDDKKVRRKEVQVEVWRLSRMVEWMWLQKSRLNWDLKGDRNTRYFHVMVKSRQGRNQINSITIDDGIVEEPVRVKQEVQAYFQRHYSEDWKSRPELGGVFKALELEIIKEVKIGSSSVGLKINYHKSVVCGVGMQDDLMHEYASVLNCKMKVGNGHRVKFWCDKWCANVSLQEEFPLLHRLAINKGESLNSMMIRKLNAREWEREEVTRLITLLEAAPVTRSDAEDVLVWAASKIGSFSVSFVYKNLAAGFGNKCPTMAWRVWTEILKWWDVQDVLPGSMESLLNWWDGVRLNKKQRLIWKSLPITVLWSLWKHRNDYIFKDVAPSEEGVCELIKVKTALWFKDVFRDHQFSINDFIINLRQIRFCLGNGSRQMY
ncbi:hypothetical protein ACSBR1_009508 [Camellia fascicularis]